MSSFLNTIPKDLPQTDPLLFSFFAIIEAVKLNIKFNGKYDGGNKKDLPAFEYAVNNWAVVEEDGYFYIEQQVLCALWKDKPDELDCDVNWDKMPDGTATNREYPMDYLYRFEDWRNKSFQELNLIIGLLQEKRKKKNDPLLLGDIFEWQILNGAVNYVYAKDTTSNKFFGVGASFTLRSPFIDCCPKISSTSLQKDYFESLGFIFPTI